ncbi:uncharacterized protein LOC126998758 isoform X2 [Eriocheir sinensis]|uniref:uncharacterized protein LOC126998758 isoform X2 n=1 Tax=Eriocheir sinensis TaxID=95602 RepID=UPI0021C581F8|nr:uncharacterized protein LOC126998758 isoform X2 [Eriocheir sinensis]
MWRAVVVVVVVCMGHITHAEPIRHPDDPAASTERYEQLSTTPIIEETDEPYSAAETKKPDEPLGPTILLRSYELRSGTLGQKEPAEDGQLRAQQQGSEQITSSGDDDNPSSISSKPQGTRSTGAQHGMRSGTSVKLKYPDHSVVLPFTRGVRGKCMGAGPFPDPVNCRYFSFCVPIEPDYNEYLQTQHICNHAYIFDDFQKNCVPGDCQSVVLHDPPPPGPPAHDPPPPSPPAPDLPTHSSPLSETPEWLNKNPSWYNEAPWWYNVPPPWYQTKPSWIEGIAKQQGADLSLEKPGEFIKNIGVDHDSSHNGDATKNFTYFDDKNMSIHIPIKIIQQ